MTYKLPFWATLLTLIGVLVLCGLGTWQLHRLEWKTRLLASIEEEYKKDAAAIPLQMEHLTRGWVQGRFNPTKEITIQPRTHKGAPGSYIFTPLILEDGSALLVNRGWMPLDMEAPAPAKGRVKIIGLLRTPIKENIFVPANNPEVNQWYRLDLVEIAKEKNIENLLPFILYAEDQTTTSEYPIASATRPNPNNNHLQYATFWFFMAGALIVVYILRFLKN